MKKSMKKVLATFAALALSCTALGFAACGENTDQPDDKPEEAKISYQFIANYDELIGWGMVYDFCANLLPDGSAEITIYRNEEDINKIQGTWKQTTDEDGTTVLTVRDGVNPDGKYEIYADSTTDIVWEDYYFTFMGSYSRKIPLYGSSEIKYEEESDWMKYIAERRKDMELPELGGDSKEEDKKEDDKKEEQPSGGSEISVKEIAVFKKDSSFITFLSDGTGKVSVFGAMNRTFTWTKAGGSVSITGLKKDDGSEQGTAKVEGNTITVTLDGGGTNYSVEFADCDLSKLA